MLSCSGLESERPRSQVSRDSVPGKNRSVQEDLGTLAVLVGEEKQRKRILRKDHFSQVRENSQMTECPADARVTLSVLMDRTLCVTEVDIGRAPPDKPGRVTLVLPELPTNTMVARTRFDLFGEGKLPQEAPHRPSRTHRRAAAGVEEEVGGVGCSRRLVGDRPVAQCHAHNGSHVSLRAKDMDGDPCGLPCRHRTVSLGEKGQEELLPKQSTFPWKGSADSRWREQDARRKGNGWSLPTSPMTRNPSW